MNKQNGYYLSIKNLIHTTTWVNFEDTMLSEKEKNRHKRKHIVRFHLNEIP